MLPPLSRRHHGEKPETSLGLPESKPAPLFLLLFAGNYQRRTSQSRRNPRFLAAQRTK
jgi:hypothetical protein